jgi:hypothetical protein
MIMMLSCLVNYNKVINNLMNYLLVKFGDIWTHGLEMAAVQSLSQNFWCSLSN